MENSNPLQSILSNLNMNDTTFILASAFLWVVSGIFTLPTSPLLSIKLV
jgi:hypothetical protein